jgi:hypothetical protein
VYQDGGSICIGGDLTIGIPSSEFSDYTLAGGSLVSSNVIINGGWGRNYFGNYGGTQTVLGLLSVNGPFNPYDGSTNYYELNGGQLSAREIQVNNNGWFVHRSGALLNSPRLTLASGGWQAATGVTRFGALQGSGTIILPAGPCVLNFSNSTSSALGFLVIRGWNGSWTSGGQHQILFGPGGLTSEQLSQIHFIRPNGIDCFFCEVSPARLLPNGELVPAQVLQAHRTGGDLVLKWDLGGVLQTATNANGPFVEVTGAFSPFTNRFLNPQRFYRLSSP